MALFATAYFGPISYYAELIHHEKPIIEQMDTFPKQTYRNRAIILTANGKLPLSVPVVRTNGNHTLTRDIEISYRENWNIQHWKTIETAYNSSPYFLYYKDGIENILMTQYTRLIDLNYDLQTFILQKLKINLDCAHSTEFTTPGTILEDYRYQFSVKETCTTYECPEYEQVFSTKFQFQPDLSIMDLLFNLGPDAKRYLLNIT